MVIYQLFARGHSVLNTSFRMHSKTVYSSKEKAEQAIPDFIKRCTDPSYLNAADPDERLTVEMLELNLDEKDVE